MDVLTPADARTVAFNARRKGYDEGEVDAFVDHVCESLAEYVAQIEQLRLDVSTAREAEDAAGAELASVREEIASLRVKVEELTKDAEDARAEATRAAEELESVRQELTEAKTEAGSSVHVRDSVALLAAAQETADKLTEAAREEVERLRAESDKVKAEAEQEARIRAAGIAATFHDLHTREEHFRTELRGLLSALSDLVDGEPVVPADANDDVAEMFDLADDDQLVADAETAVFVVTVDNDKFAAPVDGDEMLVEQTMEIPVVAAVDADGDVVVVDEGGEDVDGLGQPQDSETEENNGDAVSGSYGW